MVYNFAAGPSCLPVEVKEQIQKELLNYNNLGYSIMEMSHRTAYYDEINNQSREDLLNELSLDKNEYDVLFLQGGASTQFSMIPMNLAKKEDKTLYAITGNFANKAYEEGVHFTNAKIISSSKDKNFSYIPKIDSKDIDDDAKYLHITTNNTVFGTAYNYLPDTKNVILVGDMSSNILAKKYDFKKFGLIYAGAQKNIGIAGVTIVVIKKSLIKQATELESYVPIMMQYNIHSKKVSIYNTPPVFSIYVLSLILKWVKKMGGVNQLENLAKEKSKMIYDCIDNSKLYKGTVTAVEDRSTMNHTFVIDRDENTAKDLTEKFLKEAKDNGLVSLKGHSAAGGMRASVYNAMPKEGVIKLIDFMKKFEKENI